MDLPTGAENQLQRENTQGRSPYNDEVGRPVSHSLDVNEIDQRW